MKNSKKKKYTKLQNSKSNKYRDYLNLLAKSKTKKRRNLLVDFADKNELTAVKEIVTNLLRGNIPLNPKQVKTLRRYKKHLRDFNAPKISRNKQKNILKQHGGFLSAVLPAAIGLVTSFLAGRR